MNLMLAVERCLSSPEAAWDVRVSDLADADRIRSLKGDGDLGPCPDNIVTQKGRWRCQRAVSSKFQ